ncbi:hypothetical protein B0J11DRAFT_426523 [Dendryphion nanum]|uniref:Cholestenol delta-isomerase n=1 Tax=Dendryphion nanum TaxID=256645 RepID=A0A9P9IWB5_9PLEO|nr:hypothetical protein B0J11DRAFT_426523 [Dendryphion nanum]
MVSTRKHPSEFPAPDPSPTKTSLRKSSSRSTASPTPDLAPDTPISTSTSTPQSLAKRVLSNSLTHTNGSSAKSADSAIGWSHTTSNITLAWLAISLPLVIWDTLYIWLRPHTMAGGALQWPLWKPYEIYAAIDYVYGWPGWEKNDGFGGAQATLNAIETVLYGLYLMIVYNHSVPAVGGRGWEVREGVGGFLAGGRRIVGKRGNRAVVIAFAASVMTLSKTLLYYCNEYYSGFANVKHNDWATLAFFYGVMNGLWIIFPAYMTLVFGADLFEALDLASESASAAAKKKY